MNSEFRWPLKSGLIVRLQRHSEGFATCERSEPSCEQGHQTRKWLIKPSRFEDQSSLLSLRKYWQDAVGDSHTKRSEHHQL